MIRQTKEASLRQSVSVSLALRIVAAFVFILAACATYYALETNRHAVIVQAEHQMARLDMLLAEQTGRAIEAVDRLVVGAVGLLQAPGKSADVITESLAQGIAGVGSLAGVVAFDVAGQQIFCTDPAVTPIPGMIVRTSLERYQADPHAGLTISYPFRDVNKNWRAVLIRPIFGLDGALNGIVAGSIDLGYFEAFYRVVELNENGAVVLHLRDGTVLARFPHVDAAIGTSFGKLPPFTEVLAHAQAGTLLMESPIDGSVRVTAIRALRTLPLAVMVSVEQSRILVDWRHEALALTSVALLLVGAVVVLLLSLSNRSRQVEQLLDSTRVAHNMIEQARDKLLQQISERERAEGALRQAQRIEAIGQLTGGVAHDFNNLLTVVLGNVEILQRRLGKDDNSLLMDRLTAIRGAAERGATLTGHLLAFARRQPLMPKTIDLNETIRGMEKLLDSALGARADKRLNLAKDLWPALVDRNQIELVILNLVINARDAMPRGGVLTVSTSNRRKTKTSCVDGAPPGDYVTVSVQDTGEGIAPDILARVFEPFFTTKPPGAGSGLGLSQVFGTAKQSGGEVHIKSEVGRGTLITVTLPRSAAAPPRPDGGRIVDKLKGSKATILLVDDDEPVRAVVVMMLRDLGYTVADAGNGEAALSELAKNNHIDILLTDLVMPGMNGLQLAATVRMMQPELPIVFISGYGDQIGVTPDRDERLLRKPFVVNDLYRVIETTLTEQRGVLSKA